MGAPSVAVDRAWGRPVDPAAVERIHGGPWGGAQAGREDEGGWRGRQTKSSEGSEDGIVRDRRTTAGMAWSMATSIGGQQLEATRRPSGGREMAATDTRERCGRI
jgi:hypothetical protein